jgi:hypothetical protein
MTEIDRMREREDRARQMLTVNRRNFVKTAGVFVAGAVAPRVAWEAGALTFDRTVVEEALRPDPRSMTSTDLAPERFLAHASVEMQGAVMFWQQGRKDFPPVIAERSTRTYRGDDGRRCMAWQGDRIHLFGDGPLRARDIPMHQQPDRQLGEWAADRLERCALSGEPAFQKCRALAMRDGETVPVEWFAVLLPWGDGVVDSVTVKVV